MTYPAISATDYKAAVQRLIDNALNHPASSTGQRSAQVLCTLYNSYVCPDVDLHGIAANFDTKNMAAFTTVIVGYRTHQLDDLSANRLIDRLRAIAKPTVNAE